MEYGIPARRWSTVEPGPDQPGDGAVASERGALRSSSRPGPSRGRPATTASSTTTATEPWACVQKPTEAYARWLGARRPWTWLCARLLDVHADRASDGEAIASWRPSAAGWGAADYTIFSVLFPEHQGGRGRGAAAHREVSLVPSRAEYSAAGYVSRGSTCAARSWCAGRRQRGRALDRLRLARHGGGLGAGDARTSRIPLVLDHGDMPVEGREEHASFASEVIP